MPMYTRLLQGGGGGLWLEFGWDNLIGQWWAGSEDHPHIHQVAAGWRRVVVGIIKG